MKSALIHIILAHPDQNKTVLDVVKKMDDLVPKLIWQIGSSENAKPQFSEAGLLKLNCEKALTKK